MEDRHLSLSEVAGSMGVSERTVRRWIKSGKLKAYKPGRDYRIPESAVRTLVEESEISPKAPRRSSPEPSLFNGLEDERPLIYLRSDLEEIRGYAEAARWALEDVPSFREPSEELTAEQWLGSWSQFVSNLRHDAHYKARKWDRVLQRVSGQEMPTSERDLLDEIRRALALYDETVEKLGARFNDEWKSFRQNRHQLELSPDVLTLRPPRKEDADTTRPAGEQGSAAG